LTVTFEQLIARAEEDTLAALLGRAATRLLAALDPSLVRPSSLRRLVLDLYPADEMLRSPTTRAEVFALLRPAEATELCKALGISSANPYESLRRLSVRKRSKRENELFGYFRVVAQPGQPDQETPDIGRVRPRYQLFDHQRRAVREARTLLAEEPHRVVLHMPTGSGKTRTALNLICEELRRAEPALVIWLAYSEELCEQTATEFESAWEELGDRTVSLLRYWGSHGLDLDETQDGFLVAGLAKMYSTVKRDYQLWSRLADRTTLVIIDEAHQAVAETYQSVLELLVDRHPETRLLGLTATPGRTWNDLDADAELADFFGGRKVMLSPEGYDNPVKYLVDQGYLARTTFAPLTYKGGTELSERDRRALVEAIDIPAGLLERLAEDEERNLLIVSRVESLAQRHRRIIVFTATVDHARLLSVVLRARGINASSVTGSTPRSERERLIREYRERSDECSVLCNFGVLTTGFDAPSTSCAVIARPTKSLVLYSQMVGRAMRGPQASGNEWAEIITVVDTALPGFGDMSEAFVNWEDVWT
jgi:DNA repair protein RadD